jgi:hypothetical protein
VVRAYVVSLAGKEVSVFGQFGVGATFGIDAKESKAGVIVWGGECGWRHPHAILWTKGEGDGQGWGCGHGGEVRWIGIQDRVSSVWASSLGRERGGEVRN